MYLHADRGIKEFPPVISPMDLAIFCQREDSLEAIVDHCVGQYTYLVDCLLWSLMPEPKLHFRLLPFLSQLREVP